MHDACDPDALVKDAGKVIAADVTILDSNRSCANVEKPSFRSLTYASVDKLTAWAI
jgi:hypothetical protein